MFYMLMVLAGLGDPLLTFFLDRNYVINVRIFWMLHPSLIMVVDLEYVGVYNLIDWIDG